MADKTILELNLEVKKNLLDTLLNTLEVQNVKIAERLKVGFDLEGYGIEEWLVFNFLNDVKEFNLRMERFKTLTQEIEDIQDRINEAKQPFPNIGLLI